MDYRYMPFYYRKDGTSSMYFVGEADNEISDLDRLRELYPKTMEMIQQVIEDECDRQEYEGSSIYDRYPDKLSLRLNVKKIIRRLQGAIEEDKTINEIPEEKWMQDIVTIMLLNEMYKRRMIRRKRNSYY